MWLGKRGKSWVMFLCAMAVPVDAFAQQPKEFRLTANEFSYEPATIHVPLGKLKLLLPIEGNVFTVWP